MVLLFFLAPVIHIRMTSLRNTYQKMQRAAPSGSAAQGKTKRQREVCRLVGFLSNFVKTEDSITSYKGKSPAKKPYFYQSKMYSSKKSTPKKQQAS